MSAVRAARGLTVVGGGLAGLSLGIALRRSEGAPQVRVIEAGAYPRHRVCGEFICGVGGDTLRRLGVAGAFGAQVTNRSSRWFYRARPVLERELPEPAIGISRHHLDAWLADEFARLGGELVTGERADPGGLAGEGTVWAAGRKRRRGGRWLGLKCHARGLGGGADLEMHFGRGCYVGLSRVEGGTVNVCGMFRRQGGIAGGRDQLMSSYLRAGGLGELAARLEAAEVDSDSVLGVSAFRLGRQPRAGVAERGVLELGDAWAMIPPFTGNGMTMAFQSAELAVAPLLAYARGESGWGEACARVRCALAGRFGRRLRWALALHPLLLHPLGQRALVAAARARLVPFRLLFERTR